MSGSLRNVFWLHYPLNNYFLDLLWLRYIFQPSLTGVLALNYRFQFIMVVSVDTFYTLTDGFRLYSALEGVIDGTPEQVSLTVVYKVNALNLGSNLDVVIHNHFDGFDAFILLSYHVFS